MEHCCCASPWIHPREEPGITNHKLCQETSKLSINMRNIRRSWLGHLMAAECWTWNGGRARTKILKFCNPSVHTCYKYILLPHQTSAPGSSFSFTLPGAVHGKVCRGAPPEHKLRVYVLLILQACYGMLR